MEINQTRLLLHGYSCIRGPTKKSQTWGDEAGGGRFETKADCGDPFCDDVQADSTWVCRNKPLKQTKMLLRYLLIA